MNRASKWRLAIAAVGIASLTAAGWIGTYAVCSARADRGRYETVLATLGPGIPVTEAENRLSTVGVYSRNASYLLSLLVGLCISVGYTLETDGQTWIRRWSGTSDVLIRAHEVDRIERRFSEIEVHSRNGTSLTVTPDATGYSDLRALLEKWDSDRAIAESQSPQRS